MTTTIKTIIVKLPKKDQERKKQAFRKKRKQNYFNIWKWNNINEIWYTYYDKTISPTITTNHKNNTRRTSNKCLSV